MEYILLGIIAFIFIVSIEGNAILISRLFNSNISIESEDTFMVLLAIISDVILIIFAIKIVYNIIRSSIQKRNNQRIAAKKSRIDYLNKNISQIVKRYKPKDIPLYASGARILTNHEWLNKDVVSLVNHYKQNLSKIVDKYKEIDSHINNILNCDSIQDSERKLEYLRENEPTLSELKNESDKIRQEFSSLKIQLLNEDNYVTHILHKAFELLKSSKKCLSESIELENLIIDEKPKELNIFLYQREPITLMVCGFYYCLFSNVILVFDQNGLFSTALDPTSVLVSVTRKTAEIYVSNDSSAISHKYVDSDSKKLQEGQTTRHWLYANKDGSPDLRRTFNPLIQSRTDIYEYGEVSISINNTSVNFTISSHEALDALMLMSTEYHKKYNHLHNPTNDFLKLLSKVLGHENNILIDMIDNYSAQKKTNENYFCKVVNK